MAGAGYRTFTAGAVLTAAQVQTYLQDQSVMKFANTSAASSALGTLLSEGMNFYLSDTDEQVMYDGTSFVKDITAANALPNGDFSKWSRGTSFNGAGLLFAADRWTYWRDAYASGITASRQATSDTTNLPNIKYALRIQRDSGNTGTGLLYSNSALTNAESERLIGKTITFSGYARKGANFSGSTLSMLVRSGTGTNEPVNNMTGAVTVATAALTLTTTWQRFVVTGTVGASATQLGVEFNYTPSGTAGANDYFEFTGVQLEVGAVASPFARTGGNIGLDTESSGSAGFDGVLVSTNSSSNPSGSGTPAWAGYDVAGKNKIINGGFDFWQRGTSFASPGTSGSFSADRWSWFSDGTGITRTISQQTFTPGAAPVSGYESAYYWRMAQTVAGSGASYSILANRMEDVRTFAGQTVTLSFWAKASTSINMAQAPTLGQSFGSGGSSPTTTAFATVPALTTSWQRFTMSVAVPSIAGKTIAANSSLDLNIWLPINSAVTIDIWGVQLEVGSVATPFSRAGGTLQGELAACQRYYQRLVTGGNASVYFGNGWTVTTTAANCFFPTKVTMRVVPTSSEVGGNLQIQDTTNATFAATSASINTAQSTPDHIAVSIGVTAAIAGRVVFWGSNANANSYFAVSAEL